MPAPNTMPNPTTVVSAAWNEAECDHSSQKLCFFPAFEPDAGLGLKSSDGPTGFCGIGGGGHVGMSRYTGVVRKVRLTIGRDRGYLEGPQASLSADPRAMRAPRRARLSFMAAALHKDAPCRRGEFTAWRRMTPEGGEVGQPRGRDGEG